MCGDLEHKILYSELCGVSNVFYSSMLFNWFRVNFSFTIYSILSVGILNCQSKTSKLVADIFNLLNHDEILMIVDIDTTIHLFLSNKFHWHLFSTAIANYDITLELISESNWIYHICGHVPNQSNWTCITVHNWQCQSLWFFLLIEERP